MQPGMICMHYVMTGSPEASKIVDIPLQKGVVYEMSESYGIHEGCHDDGDKDKSIALDEQVEAKLPKSTSKILHGMKCQSSG